MHTGVICVKVPEQRLCRGLLAALPLLTERGGWTINSKLALALAKELYEMSVGESATSGEIKLWVAHLHNCELSLISLYEQWANFAEATVPARDDKPARDLWDKLLAARRALSAAIVDAYNEDGHVYPLSNAPPRASHMGTPEQVRSYEAELARRQAGAPPPGARDGKHSLESVKRVLLRPAKRPRA